MPDAVVLLIARVLAERSAFRDGKDADTAASFADAAWEDFAADAEAVLSAIHDTNDTMIVSAIYTNPDRPSFGR